MKTIVFTMLLRGRDINIQHVCHSKIIKNHTWNPNILLDTSNHRKYRKVIQMVSNGGRKIDLKSIKIQPGTIQDLPECICAPLDHQNGAKVVSKDFQINPKSLLWGPKLDIQINKIRYPYTCCSFVDSTVSILEIPPVLQIPPDHKLPNCCFCCWP